MKTFLKKMVVFEFNLKIFSVFSKHDFCNPITKILTTFSAKLMLSIHKPEKTSEVKELVKIWQRLMPIDGKDKFIIKSISKNTAITEIHIKCPLRETGNVNACYRLMNYDRTLMQKVGGQLIVLESQSNSGNKYCKLAIRKEGSDLNDLQPAHLVNSE